MHPSDTYSWGGAFDTYWIDPTNEIFVSGMVQIANGGAQHLGRRLPYPDLTRRSPDRQGRKTTHRCSAAQESFVSLC
jgi:hypothetical protein